MRAMDAETRMISTRREWNEFLGGTAKVTRYKDPARAGHDLAFLIQGAPSSNPRRFVLPELPTQHEVRRSKIT
jgi:hypothetical protein